MFLLWDFDSQMESSYGLQLVLVLCLGMFMGFTKCEDIADAVTAVYIVTLRQAPASHYYDELRAMARNNGSKQTRLDLDTPRYYFPHFIFRNSILCFNWVYELGGFILLCWFYCSY